jgi:hypothetical protein
MAENDGRNDYNRKNVAMKILTDPKVPVAVAAALSAILVLFNVDPQKREQAQTVIIMLGVVASVLVGAMGYAEGKLNEGVNPDGTPIVPKTPGVNVNLITPAATLDGTTMTTQTTAAGTPGQAGATTTVTVNTPAATPVPTPETQRGGPVPPGGLGVGLVLFGTIVFLAFNSAGCTSEAFKRGIPATVPGIAQEYRDYVNTDATLDARPVERMDRLSDADALEAAGKSASLSGVERAWSRVEPPYREYLATDPTLDEMDKSVAGATGDYLDRVIAAERTYQANQWRIFGVPPPPEIPPPTRPTTAPAPVE